MRTSEHVTVHSPAWRRRPWRGTDARRGAGRDESGAILILALIFLVVVGGIVGSLASWATNDLNNTTKFASARTQQYAVSSTTETAVQNIRYTPLLSTDQTPSSAPSYCWGAGPTSELTLDNATVAVWCSTVWTPTSASTRVVTFSACPVTSAESGDSAATLASLCAAAPALQAVVTFGDYQPGYSAPNGGQCFVYCGTSMTVNSWVWSG